jgi:hypothetical protein
MASSDVSASAGNKQAVARLLKETIVQLCRANVQFSGGGRIEVDGIICISGQVEGQELVVKVHEVLREGGVTAATSSTEPLHHHPAFGNQQQGGNAVGGFANHRDLFSSTFGNDAVYAGNGDSCSSGGSDAKRRRLDGFDALHSAAGMPPPPHPSALYAYLSRFGYDPLGVRSAGSGSSIFGSSPSEIDYRRLVAAAVGGSRPFNQTRPSATVDVSSSSSIQSAVITGWSH